MCQLSINLESFSILQVATRQTRSKNESRNASVAVNGPTSHIVEQPRNKHSEHSKDMETAKQSSLADANKVISENNFEIGSIVWCKLKGFRHYPAKIVSFFQKKYLVRWYNDYRLSSVFTSQLQPFSKYCLVYSENVSISLATAIKEALIEYRNKMK